MFDRIVRRFLDHTFDPKPPVLTAPKKIIYFCLPFTGNILCRYAPKSASSATPLFLIFTLDTFYVLKKGIFFFPFKDKYLRSSVVYLFKCRCCSASYMGKPRAIYTLGYQNIWVSLQSRENTQPTLLSLLFSPIQTPLDTQLTFTTFKFFLPPLTHTS